MKYICLVHFAPSALAALTPTEMERSRAESYAYDMDLEARGQLLAAEALQAPGTAVLVQVRAGKVSTTDGPYAETKEHLGGFLLVDARDLNEAIRIAAGIPLAQLGTIEVRPVLDFSKQGDRE